MRHDHAFEVRRLRSSDLRQLWTLRPSLGDLADELLEARPCVVSGVDFLGDLFMSIRRIHRVKIPLLENVALAIGYVSIFWGWLDTNSTLFSLLLYHWHTATA
jgi:hypothetical protein